MAQSVDSDATERSLPLHRDIDPVRMMRTRFADPIRASSPPGLHQQAGHMTASDLCAARQMISAAAWPLAAGAQQPTIGFIISSTLSAERERITAFLQRLRELGWNEGRTI